MRKWTILVLLVLGLGTQGCDGMNGTQSAALIGALGTGLIGSQLGDSSDRTRNALIGTAIGAAGGYLYGKNKQNSCQQQPYIQRPSYTQQQPIYQYQQPRTYTQEELMQREIELLRRENELLKKEKQKEIINLDGSI